MNNIIEIELNNNKDYKNKFNQNRISKELNNYILNEIKSINLTDRIILEIETKFKITEEEKENLVKMIKLSFNDELKELKILEKVSFNKSLILIGLGIMSLIIYYLLLNMIFISEFILIIGWLFIWEAIYELLFSKIKNKISQIRRNQLIHSKIIFK